jgi:hypothetical protein
MSLKNYIKQVEQLNEFAPSAPTMSSTTQSTTQPTTPAQKVLVKPGQPQQQQQQQQAPQATITNQAGKVIAQGDAADTKKLGDLVNAGQVTMMDPMTGKPLQEDDLEETNPYAVGMAVAKREMDDEPPLEKKTINKAHKIAKAISKELEESLTQLESQFPHEVKMYKEGWGLDEDLYHRIAEACHGAGEVPHKVWHGDLNELRNFVEGIYASHHGLVDESIQTDHTGDMNLLSYEQLMAKADEAEAQGNQQLAQQYFQAAQHKQSNMRQVAKQGSHLKAVREDDLEEETSLERSLRASQQSKEETMFEGKETTDKGVKHTGSYGKRHGKEEVRDQYGAKIGKIDLDKEAKKDEPKRGKGRPKKDAGDAGVAFDTSELDNAFGGAAKKSAAKKLDKSHDKKKTVKHKVDEQISSWDQQLKTLLESKQINEGITVSTSMGQEQAPDSVSVSATDEDAHTLLKIIHDAGLGVKTDAREEMLKAHGMSGEGGSFSINPTDDEANDVEVVDFDTAQGDLEGEEDNGDDTLSQIKKMLGIGVDAAPEPKHPEGFDGEEGEEESEEEEESDEGEDKVAVVDEEEVEEGNKFTGNLAKAREEGETEADLDGDGDKEKVEPAGEESEEDSEEDKVEESHQTCNECGGMLEEGHDCSAEQVEEGQLNEWANSREGISEDERFFAAVKFMTNDISGGLNGQKKDQTVMPHTAVKVIEAGDVAAQMKKLAGI